MIEPKDVTEAWYWEGNVAAAIADGLKNEEWNIESMADTRSRARGIDVHAVREGRSLLVEVKGYPSTSYRDPARACETKRTRPASQAQHWFSHALLKAVRLQTSHAEALVALGFPYFEVYDRLLNETRPGLVKLGISVLWVHEDTKIVWALGPAGTANNGSSTGRKM